jgi:DNA-binding transcriptional LysR family regulator
VLNRLLAAYPALNVHMRLSDERVHLVTEGLDAVIRIGSLDDSGLVARQFDHQHLVLCSSPPYVKIHGALRAVEEVEKRSVIVFRMPASGRERPLEFVDDGERKRSRCGHNPALL